MSTQQNTDLIVTNRELLDIKECLALATTTNVELRRELVATYKELNRVSAERARLFDHVASHANCCTAEGNIEFASKVARGVK